MNSTHDRRRPAVGPPPPATFIALDGIARTRVPTGHAARPLPASLRWGLGWTVLVASLAVSAGCTADATVDAPVDPASGDYASCVAELGGSPDAIEHRIDACEVARRIERRGR